MKKTIKHEGKAIGTVEIDSRKDGHTITAKIGDKVVSTKHLPLEDDLSHYAEQMEEELKVIASPKKRSVNPHLKKLKDKGYK